MFLDWFSREGIALLSWWFMSLLAGLAVMPLLARFAAALPGRGYALARAAGLILIGFVYWLLNNLGLLDNSPGATVVAALIVFGISLFAYSTRPRPVAQAADDGMTDGSLWGWLRSNAGLILVTELLFIGLFLGWATVRALNPDLSATEKPMEMAFLSAVRRSAQFPPHDPWMSGYAISYYHFGYILMGTLANLSGVTNGQAFNLSVALLFALTGVGAFGVVYELVASRLVGQNGGKRPAILAGLAACLFAVIMGNLGTALVEVPYQTGSASDSYLAFWDMEERDNTRAGCAPSLNADPTTWCYWWWFRHSRVVTDYDLSGNPLVIQPITEFPNFSFLLADVHPHVLALPFAALAIGLSLNLVLTRRRPYPWEMLLYGVFIGGMVFLNSWDAVYIGLFVGAEALRRLLANGTGRFQRRDWFGIAGFGVTMLVLTGLLYLPFFVGFRSQAGGIVPNILWPTQFQQFFLMFGPFLVILGVFLAAEWRRAGRTFNLPLAMQLVLILVGFLLAALVLLGIVAWTRDDVRFAVYQVFEESGGLAALLPQIILRRLQGALTHAVLLIGLLVIIARLFAREPRREDGGPDDARQVITYSPATGFTLLIIAAGAALALAPDFVYLRDGFGVRINTMFKFYYQAWLLWSIASGYALWSILSEVTVWAADKRKFTLGEDGEIMLAEPDAAESEARRWRVSLPARTAFSAVTTLLVLMGLLYPAAGIASRAVKDGGWLSGVAQALTLEGGPSLAAGMEDYLTIACLARTARSDQDVVAEATKENIAYNITGIYSRVATLSGIPTLVGWDNHQRQWRGSTFEQARTLTFVRDGVTVTETRQQAIAMLYNTTDLQEALGVLDRYGITYIYVGPTERRDFSPEGLAKFAALTPVCQNGGTAVYTADSFRGLVQSTARSGS